MTTATTSVKSGSNRASAAPTVDTASPSIAWNITTFLGGACPEASETMRTNVTGCSAEARWGAMRKRDSRDTVRRVEFREMHPPNGPVLWDVCGARTGFYLGSIEWYPGWSKYCYSPHVDGVYDAGMLEEIAKFCTAKTVEKRGK